MLQAVSLSLEERYKSAFENYLRGGDESQLSEAYDIGHQALESDYSLVNLINVHCDALSNWLGRSQTAQPMTALATASGRMLMQATAPYTVLQKSESETASALRKLNALYDASTHRFAHALHDDAAQMLSVAYLELSQLREEVPDSARERIERLSTYLDQTREQLRHLSHELRPPVLEHFGLATAVRHLAGGFEQRYGLAIDLKLAELDRELIRAIELSLYRAVHEGLTNVIRHAQATQAWVRIDVVDQVVLCTVRDNGKGFEPQLCASTNPDAGLGLISLRERISACLGKLEVESIPGQGTCLRITLPLEA